MSDSGSHRRTTPSARITLAAGTTAPDDARVAAAPAAPGEPERRSPSGIPVPLVVRPDDGAVDYALDLGEPGRFPFTRGVQPTMYRGRHWTMRQYAGFGTAQATNERFKLLLAKGQTGLSTAFDLPTQMGIDSDHPRALGEVGRVGVAIDSVDDLHVLLADLPLDRVSTSMTINATASTLLAMYVTVAEERGITRGQVSGTIQNDILKEYIARGTYVYPPGPSLALIAETFRFCAAEVPNWNPISISGYHIREAGSTAVQELAFTFANALAYVQAAVDAGLRVDDFAPRLSFFFACHNDLFEEVAKFRAARRIWARLMRERHGASDASCKLRFHTQTGGVTLTAQQPLNNVVRVTVQALAAALGGTQSLHTNGYDEAFAIPTEEAMKMALRTQQIIAEETNVASVIDPLGGSYYVEALTTEYEKKIFEILGEIERRGGTIKLIEQGWFQKQIADFAYETALRKQSGEKPVIGVNRFVEKEGRADIEIHPYDQTTADRQIARTQRVRRERDPALIERLLDQLVAVAQNENDNIMPITIELVKHGATMGDIVEKLRGIWGTYRETPVF